MRGALGSVRNVEVLGTYRNPRREKRQMGNNLYNMVFSLLLIINSDTPLYSPICAYSKSRPNIVPTVQLWFLKKIQSTHTVPCGSDLKVYFPLFIPHPTTPRSFHRLRWIWCTIQTSTALYGSEGSKSFVPDIRMTTQSLSKLAQNAAILYRKFFFWLKGISFALELYEEQLLSEPQLGREVHTMCTVCLVLELRD